MDPHATPFDHEALLSVENAAAAALLKPLVPHCVVSSAVTEFIVSLFHFVPGSCIALDVDAAQLHIDREENASRPARKKKTESEAMFDSSSASSVSSSKTACDNDDDESTDEPVPRKLHDKAYPYIALPVFFNWRRRMAGDPTSRPVPLALRFRNVNDTATADVCIRTAVVFEAESLTLEGRVKSLGSILSDCKEITNTLVEEEKNNKRSSVKTFGKYRVPPRFDVSGLSELQEFPNHNGFAVWRSLVELYLPPLQYVPLKTDNFFGQHSLERLVFHPETQLISFSSSSFCFAYKLTRLDVRACTRMVTFGNHCFQGCNALVTVCARGLPHLRDIGSCVFVECEALKLFDCRNCAQLSSTGVEASTFKGCKSLSVILCDPPIAKRMKEHASNASEKTVIVSTTAVDLPTQEGGVAAHEPPHTDVDNDANEPREAASSTLPPNRQQAEERALQDVDTERQRSTGGGEGTASRNDDSGWFEVECCCGTVRVPRSDSALPDRPTPDTNTSGEKEDAAPSSPKKHVDPLAPVAPKKTKKTAAPSSSKKTKRQSSDKDGKKKCVVQ